MHQLRESRTGEVEVIEKVYSRHQHLCLSLIYVNVFAGAYACPSELDEFLCSRSHIRDFAQEAKALGVQYIGLCCGNRAHYLREIAEVYGKQPPASRYARKQGEHLTAQSDQEREYQKQHYIADLRDYPAEG